jgi:hypothetical protein
MENKEKEMSLITTMKIKASIIASHQRASINHSYTLPQLRSGTSS